MNLTLVGALLLLRDEQGRYYTVPANQIHGEVEIGARPPEAVNSKKAPEVDFLAQITGSAPYMLELSDPDIELPEEALRLYNVLAHPPTSIDDYTGE